MELYTQTSYRLAEQLTKEYSTSFSLSSRFFSKSIRDDIYAIYGMVRIADEIVDTHRGEDAAQLLGVFEDEVLTQIKKTTPFSTNPIIHAFCLTARRYEIDASLVKPFFESMRTDLTERKFTQEAYEKYIYGSAEVVGLMCLKIFTAGDLKAYESLANSARALSRAYQKVNFLRDIADDHQTRQRYYFPIGTFESLDDTVKRTIENDIRADFEIAKAGIGALPVTAKKAVTLSYAYYFALFEKLTEASANELKLKRIRLPSMHKSQILAKHLLKNGAN